MRFNEFKTIITEATKGKQADIAKFDEPGYFTVGDSHSNGIGNYGRGNTWKAMGMDGASAFDSMHMSAIERIPAGSVVAISLGANDFKAKKPIPQIVSQVNDVINSAKSKGLQVIYLLPTSTTGRDSKARDELRSALNTGVTVPTYDLGPAGSDGLHLSMPSYANIASRIVSEHKPSVSTKPLGTPNAVPGAPPTKDKDTDPVMKAFRTDGSFYVPMLVGNKGPEVADLQKALIALGYNLPKYGVDGIIGKETKAAVRAFQNDKKLQVDGIAGKDTITAVNNTITSNPKIVSSLKQSTQADVKARVQDVATGDAKSGTGATDSATIALKFFMSKGWSTEQAAGIVGNLQAESGANLKTDAIGDNGQAYGIAQWHPPRQKDFSKTTGKDIRGSSLQDQLTFVDWELNNTERNAGNQLKTAKTAQEAAWIMDEYYERSTGAHRQNRINNAVALASTPTTA